MEYGHEANASTMNGSLLMPVDPSEHARNSQDIMNRRLKNRERQRRYRARKRLEAEKKASILSQSNPLHIEPQLPEPANICVTSVHSRIRWKEVARRAHIDKEEFNKSSGLLNMNTTSVIGGQIPYIPSGVDQQLSIGSEIQSGSTSTFDSIETTRSKLSFRRLKELARNK